DKKIEIFRRLLEIKRYSVNSIETYVNAFRQFLLHFKGQDVDVLTERQIAQYINQQVTERKISVSYQKQLVAAIKFSYLGVLARKTTLMYLYPDRPELMMPMVLSQHEIRKMLSICENIKHKAFVATTYSCGSTLSELTSLRINDVDSNAMTVTIREG